MYFQPSRPRSIPPSAPCPDDSSALSMPPHLISSVPAHALGLSFPTLIKRSAAPDRVGPTDRVGCPRPPQAGGKTRRFFAFWMFY